MGRKARGGLTMAAAYAGAEARLAAATALVEAQEPGVVDPAFPLTAGFSFHITTVLLIRADRDPAFMAKLECVADMAIARPMWDLSTSGGRSPDGADARLLDEGRLLRNDAETQMMEAMEAEVLAGPRAIRFSTDRPFRDLALDDGRTVADIADTPAAAGACMVVLPHTRRPQAMTAPSWRDLATLVNDKVGRARNPRGVYFEGLFPLDPALHGGATHEVFMGS